MNMMMMMGGASDSEDSKGDRCQACLMMALDRKDLAIDGHDIALIEKISYAHRPKMCWTFCVTSKPPRVDMGL
jgi:hypothetical protein